MRILGIDYGTKRIGLALGDTESGIAGPWRVIENEGMDEAVLRLQDLAEEEHVEEIVLGVPMSPDGRIASDIAEDVLAFMRLLKAKDLIVHKENELLSSKVAASQMEDVGRKEKRDDLAATAILQTYLDRLSHTKQAHS